MLSNNKQILIKKLLINYKKSQKNVKLKKQIQKINLRMMIDKSRMFQSQFMQVIQIKSQIIKFKKNYNQKSNILKNCKIKTFY